MSNLAPTPKDQAIRIYKKFRNLNPVLSANNKSKNQAIACVDEILAALEFAFSICPNQEDGFGFATIGSVAQDAKDYWNDVKIEIALL